MNKHTIIKASIALAFLAVAGYLLLRPNPQTPEESAGYADPTASYWLCTSAACGKGYELSLAELGAFLQDHPGAAPPCPHCKSEGSLRAMRCAACKEIIPKVARAQSPDRSASMHTGPALCPKCNKPSGAG
ncbi:MAG TPA: hypothetical protein VK176_00440 [Phycisphaerales bacterium]|nr:hypothetical protein [Phycisphaerales bacterium]